MAKELCPVSVQAWHQAWQRGNSKGWVGGSAVCGPERKHADKGKDTVCRKGGVKTACMWWTGLLSGGQ